MKRSISTFFACALACVAGATQAATVFSDNFDSESLGLNYTGFAQWAVSNGTVDLIGAPGFHDLQPGNGRYVDLDGSTGNAGVLRSSNFGLTNGVSYKLQFDLAGSWRGDFNTLVYGIDLNGDSLLDFSASQGLASNVPFTSFSLIFTPGVSTGNASIVFDLAGGDNIGLLLDNVLLTSMDNDVPEPMSLSLLGLGLLGIGAARRRN